MTRRSTGMPAELLGRGTSLLKSSPELTQLTDTVRGELLGAVRSAAVTAASNRIDALNNRLQLGSALVADQETDEPEEADSEEDDYDDQPARDDERASAEEDTGKPATRTRPRRSGTTAARKTASRSADRGSGSADRKPPSPARRRSRADADDAPVRRTRR
ncbi:hypothetical protein ACWF82_03510 [Nocardia sp. NPDC055053]